MISSTGTGTAAANDLRAVCRDWDRYQSVWAYSPDADKLLGVPSPFPACSCSQPSRMVKRSPAGAISMPLLDLDPRRGVVDPSKNRAWCNTTKDIVLPRPPASCFRESAGEIGILIDGIEEWSAHHLPRLDDRVDRRRQCDVAGCQKPDGATSYSLRADLVWSACLDRPSNLRRALNPFQGMTSSRGTVASPLSPTLN
jgi:hypothetical protein